jgi:hypothetical protein
MYADTLDPITEDAREAARHDLERARVARAIVWDQFLDRRAAAKADPNDRDARLAYLRTAGLYYRMSEAVADSTLRVQRLMRYR